MEGILESRDIRIPAATTVGDAITAAHEILNEQNESRLHQRFAVVVQDLATQWIQSCPCQNHQMHLARWEVYSESFLKKQAWSDLHWQIFRVESRHMIRDKNGIAERAVRRVQEGTSALSVKCGQDEQWWREAMECCHSRNIQDLWTGVKTLHEWRYENSIQWSHHNFWSRVLLLSNYPPMTEWDVFHPGHKSLEASSWDVRWTRENGWTQCLFVTDAEITQNIPASEVLRVRSTEKRWKWRHSNGMSYSFAPAVRNKRQRKVPIVTSPSKVNRASSNQLEDVSGDLLDGFANAKKTQKRSGGVAWCLEHVWQLRWQTSCWEPRNTLILREDSFFVH